MRCDWIFDDTPASGSRSGGDAAEYAFTPDLEVFVREVMQNSKDQHVAENGNVSIVFRLIKLRGLEARDFLTALSWNVLGRHIKSAAESSKVPSLLRAYERVESTGELLILCIEDNNATGLIGPERGDGNFAALVRDSLFSSKPEASAGGSYGLGKSVLWRFSSMSTVMFNSDLYQGLGERTNPRLIGRATLPWHLLGSDEFSGDGWFGEAAKDKKGRQWAESVWGADARSLAEKLRIDRKAGLSGSSILIVGFEEPAREERPLDEIAKAIERAALIWFWPTISDKATGLEVRIEIIDEGKTVSRKEVTSHQAAVPFVEAFRAYQAGESKLNLENPGDVIAVPIQVSVPARLDGTVPSYVAEAVLVVRLAGPEIKGDDPNRNSVAYFRGPGMVIEYRKLERLSLTARPFHALLIAGQAKEGANDSEDLWFDQTLRAAEPPQHNEWTSTKALKDLLKLGYKKMLDGLNDSVRLKLKELVSEKISGGSDGPQLLVRKFPFGSRSGGGNPKQPIHFRDLDARLTERGEWEFRGKAITRTKTPKGWEISVDLRFAEEGSGKGEGGFVRELTANFGKVSYDNGIATVTLLPPVSEITFEGKTDPSRYPIDARRGTVELVLNGKKLS